MLVFPFPFLSCVQHSEAFYNCAHDSSTCADLHRHSLKENRDVGQSL